MQEKICSFTGHRQIEKNHEMNISALILRSIEYAYDNGCRIFMAGGAIGFDTLAAREVIRFRMTHRDVKLRLALPCKEQDKSWSHEQRERYFHTLAEADEIVYLSDEYTKDCMKRRNDYLATSADILIAYVNRSRSGAAQTVRMAERLSKKVYNLYPALDNTK